MREYRLYLNDIKEALEKIDMFIANASFDEFIQDVKTVDAVLRNLEIIGEASKHIPKAVREKYSDIDWRAIIGMRNIIAHEYFGVRLQIIWKTLKERLPELKEAIEKIISDNF